MTPSRLIAFLAALVLSLAGGSDAAAKSARREILAAVESAASELARASAERVWENLASEGNLASGPRDYPYAQVVEEYTSTATTPKTLAATFTFADELVSQTRYANGALTTRFIQFDGFGSTRWLTDASGAITDKVDYDAFGVEISRTGTTDIDHLYRGEVFDPNVGFYYLRARWMDQSTGRFTQVDPWEGSLGLPTTLNKYLYVLNDPIQFNDPSGREPSLPGTSVAAKIDAIIASGAQASFRLTLRKVGRECICIAVEEVVQTVLLQALTGGVYVLVDGKDLYGGRTNDFERRFYEHVNDTKKNIQKWLLRFHFDGKRNYMRLVEQFFMEFLKDRHSLTNRVRSIAEEGGSKNTRKLRNLLGKLDFCK